MRKNRIREYFLDSMTGFGSLALAIIFFFTLYKIKIFWNALVGLISILMPFIYGLVISFILSPLCNRICKFLDERIPRDGLNRHKRNRWINFCGVFGALAAAIIVVYILLVMLLPQLFESIMNVATNMDSISASFSKWVNKFLSEDPEQRKRVMEIYNTIGSNVTDWVQNTMIPKLQEMITGLSDGIIGFVNVLKNIILGMIISVYLMSNRKLYSAQAKKMMYSLLPQVWANRILIMCRHVGDIFSSFLLGKILDSAIIGLICFVVMNILRMPYSMLISTLVGVTNIIPYFGPFFGAIPSTILILTVSPLQALYFVIFILVLQQIDGNIIGPKILGDSTGLASFWVLFSLLLFGGLFGVVGMIIGVPCFAVIYDLVGSVTGYFLEKKGLSVKTEDYLKLKYIDPISGEYVDMEPDDRQQRKADRQKPDYLKALLGGEYLKDMLKKSGIDKERDEEDSADTESDEDDWEAVERVEDAEESADEDAPEEVPVKRYGLRTGSSDRRIRKYGRQDIQ